MADIRMLENYDSLMHEFIQLEISRITDEHPDVPDLGTHSNVFTAARTKARFADFVWAKRMQREKKVDTVYFTNHGKLWTDDQFYYLAIQEEKEVAVVDIALKMRRTPFAIECKLGLHPNVNRAPQLDIAKNRQAAVQRIKDSDIDRYEDNPADPFRDPFMRPTNWSISTTNTFPKRTSSSLSQPPQQPKKEIQMQIETNVTLINGQRADKISDEGIFGFIKELEDSLEILNRTSNKSVKFTAKIKSYQDNINTLIEIVDNRPAQ
jgi:hypothetical protein